MSIIVNDHGNSLLLTNMTPVSGSTAAPPHSPPPSNPGNIQTPSLLGGVKGALYLILLNFSINSLFVSGSRLATSSGPKCWRAKGSGRVGIGCVGQASSPARSDTGTGLSSTGKMGSPVVRSKRKTYPCFVIL